jgi:hypothetical protein
MVSSSTCMLIPLVGSNRKSLDVLSLIDLTVLKYSGNKASSQSRRVVIYCDRLCFVRYSDTTSLKALN